MKKKTAVLFGATGLTGSHVLQQLIKDERYNRIKIFARSDLPVKNDKAKIIKTSLEDLHKYENEITGHEVFCCLGTTIKKAGTRDNFKKVDLEFPAKIAEIASRNEIPGFLMISSIGADIQSSNFYLKTKGEAEKAVQEFSFKKVVILRPSMLMGKRNEFRFAEEVGKVIIRPFIFLMRGRLRKYRPVDAERVATAMIKLANIDTDKNIFESHEIVNLTLTEQ